MQRAVTAPSIAKFVQGSAGAWLARRWYYTARTHRAYSIRQVSPGDRRLLAEFAVLLTPHIEDDRAALTTLVFDRLIADADDVYTFSTKRRGEWELSLDPPDPYQSATVFVRAT
jgi:hypothetical protein